MTYHQCLTMRQFNIDRQAGKRERTIDPADRQKYAPVPDSLSVRVPIASIVCNVLCSSSSCAFLDRGKDSEPNLILSNSSESKGCRSSDEVDWKIARASS